MLSGRDREVAGSSLSGGTVVSLRKRPFNPLLSTGSTQEDRMRYLDYGLRKTRYTDNTFSLLTINKSERVVFLDENKPQNCL